MAEAAGAKAAADAAAEAEAKAAADAKAAAEASMVSSPRQSIPTLSPGSETLTQFGDQLVAKSCESAKIAEKVSAASVLRTMLQGIKRPNRVAPF